MSWERSKFEARCDTCGATGFCIQSSDDWGRSETDWIGFANQPPSGTAVARGRAGPRDSLPLCTCGSRAVTIGTRLGDCDSNGRILGSES